jgi:N-acetylglucosaminyl-diphospho-decaprenol L-rhamnosyltransferase
MTVAVVVGNWRGEAVLVDCLRSLDEQTLRPAEVIVVDASSTDRSVTVAEELGARVLVRPNRGLGHLYNEGARAAGGDYVLCVNNDVALEQRCLELLAGELDVDASRFAADPRQVDWSGERLVHARARLSRGPLLRQPLPGFRLELTSPAATVVPTLSGNGGAMLVRRERLLELGGFDETMFMDFEDLDLCWRAWLRGWPSVYVPDAVVRHRVGAVTSQAVLRRRLVSSHHNLLRFALKCLPARQASRVVVGELLRLPRHPRLVGPALWQLACEVPEVRRQRRAASPSARFTRWVLDGMPGALPPAAGGASVRAAEERERRLQEDLQVDER